MITKPETFKRLLAGDYDDARYVTLKTDSELLLEMHNIGWWPYSRPLCKDNLEGLFDHQGYRISFKEGSKEWKKDIMKCLKELDRI